MAFVSSFIFSGIPYLKLAQLWDSALQEHARLRKNPSIQGQQLWDSLARICVALDGSEDKPSDSTQILERLIAHLQVARLTAHRQKQKASQAPNAERLTKAEASTPKVTSHN